MIFIILVLIIATPFLVGLLISGPRYLGPITDHFDGKRFFNHDGIKAKGGSDVLKWMFTRQRGEWINQREDKPVPHPLAYYNDGFRITFINHSTFLIQVDGVNILTDPVWSNRVSPFTLLGPKRKRNPAIAFEDLPKIHYVLLTHNHYDHLDIATLRVIQGAHHPKIITTLGIKKLLDSKGVAGSSELDWWEHLNINNLTVQCIPAQHFSGRGLLDRDASLWCGFTLGTRFGKLYFAGDTGYNEKLFTMIHQKIGEVKIAILPIGAYKPSWFMSPIHTSPHEAVKIHQHIRPQISIATHFGTFQLADDGLDDPANDLAAALSQAGVASETFVVPIEGQPINL